jgi:hypothetical protein
VVLRNREESVEKWVLTDIEHAIVCKVLKNCEQIIENDFISDTGHTRMF